jgi:hypothetical protein
VSTDWQIATDSQFTNIIETSMNDGVNLYAYLSNIPVVGTPVFARVRFRLNMGITNWSNITSCEGEVNEIETPEIIEFLCEIDGINTPVLTVDVSDGNGNNTTIQTPNLSIYDNPWNMSLSPKVLSDNFIDLAGNGQTHTATSWRIEDLGNQTSTVETGNEIWSSLNNATNLTELSIPSGLFEHNKRYRVYASYHSLSDTSNAGSIIITTRARTNWTEYDVSPLIYDDTSLAQINREEIFISTQNASAFLKYNLNTKTSTGISHPVSPANNLGLNKLLETNQEKVICYGYGDDKNEVYEYDNNTGAWNHILNFPNPIYEADGIRLNDGNSLIAVIEDDNGSKVTKLYLIDYYQAPHTITEVYNHNGLLYFSNAFKRINGGIEEIGLINNKKSVAGDTVSLVNTATYIETINWTTTTENYLINITNYITSLGTIAATKYRYNHPLVTNLDNDQLTILGGLVEYDGNAIRIKDVDGYDLNNNTPIHNLEPELPVPVSNSTALRLRDGRIVVMSGKTMSQSDFFADNEIIFILT